MNEAILTSEAGAWLKIVVEQVKTLRYGVVQIVIHDNRVVQIEKTEKVRLDRRPEAAD